jgi:hypothetical protein
MSARIDVNDQIYEEPEQLQPDLGLADSSWKEYNLLCLGTIPVLAHPKHTDSINRQMAVASVVTGAFWLLRNSWSTSLRPS